MDPIPTSETNSSDPDLDIGTATRARAQLLETLHALRIAVPASILAAIVVAVAVYVGSKALPPTFEATATLLVTPNNGALSNSGLSVAVPPAIDATAYADFATSTDVLKLARASLGESASLSRYDISAAATAMQVSSVVTIRVRGPTATGVKDVANAVANSLIAWDNERARANVATVKKALAQQVQTLRGQLAAAGSPRAASQPQINVLTALLDTKLHELGVAASLQDSPITPLSLVEAAAEPVKPASPRPHTYALVAAIVSFLGVFGFFLVRRSMDTRVRTTRDLESIAGVKLLGTLSAGDLQRKRAATSRDKYLLANVLAATGDDGGVIGLTSARFNGLLPRVAFQLALGFATGGRPVLLVDGDLTEPRLTRALKAPNAKPFVTHLQDVEGTYAPARISAEKDVGVDFVPGAPGPQEHTRLLKRNFEALLGRWKEHYEAVVVALPEVDGSADVIAMAPRADGIVMAVFLGKDDAGAVHEALASLRRCGGKLLGLVAVEAGVTRRGRAART